MQFQADLRGIPVIVPMISETTSLGAAYLTGLAVDIWKDMDELAGLNPPAVIYYPKMREEKRGRFLSIWRRAVQRALEWKSIKFFKKRYNQFSGVKG